MIYFDYAACTPIDKEVLDLYYDCLLKYYGNPNSTHTLGREAKEMIDSSTANIARLLGVEGDEIIYTSGATESNNLAIRGVCERNKDKGKHVLLSTLEHSSLTTVAQVLEEEGFNIDVIPVKDNGLVDIEQLKGMLRDDTIFVSVVSVDSELGLVQPIEEIGELLKSYPNAVFHTDASQAVGKVNIDYRNVDLITVSPHKFYGVNDLGILVKRKEVNLKPIIFGGRSTTVFRSGTPNTASIIATSFALEKAMNEQQERFNYVSNLNKEVKEYLSSFDEVHINTNENSMPFTINFSVKGVSSGRVVDILNDKGICVSSKTSCCPVMAPSKLVMALTNEKSLAVTSIRLSLSHLTTEDEIGAFKEAFEETLNDIKGAHND